jgi:hypothetical protein
MKWFLLIPFLTTSCWFLGALAGITERPRAWIAIRLPDLIRILNCAACSGTWYGFAFGAFFDPADDLWLSILVTGACSMVWTPFLGALLVRSLFVISEAINDE